MWPRFTHSCATRPWPRSILALPSPVRWMSRSDRGFLSVLERMGSEASEERPRPPLRSASSPSGGECTKVLVGIHMCRSVILALTMRLSVFAAAVTSTWRTRLVLECELRRVLDLLAAIGPVRDSNGRRRAGRRPSSGAADGRLRVASIGTRAFGPETGSASARSTTAARPR